MATRAHITLPDELVRELDRRVGTRKRSSFIASFIAGALRRALDDERRWELVESALGSIADGGHDWDEDAGGWVRDQRRTDPDRVG